MNAADLAYHFEVQQDIITNPQQEAERIARELEFLLTIPHGLSPINSAQVEATVRLLLDYARGGLAHSGD